MRRSSYTPTPSELLAKVLLDKGVVGLPAFTQAQVVTGTNTKGQR